MIGTGVLRGMLVTLRQFIGTYPLGRWLLSRFGLSAEGLFTIQYPETKQQHPERFRYFPFLIYDGTPDNLRCVACKICEQECPPQCIYIEEAKDEQGRPIRAYGRRLPRTFNIDTSICMSCRICVDVCPFDAIEMDNQFELANYERFTQMIQRKDDLLKPNEYFQKIRPEESSVVDARLSAKAKKPAPVPAASTPPAAAAPSAPPAAPKPPPARGQAGLADSSQPPSPPPQPQK